MIFRHACRLGCESGRAGHRLEQVLEDDVR
jgi:hypothetical protein